MGPGVAAELLRSGHAVTVFHRGRSVVKLPPGAETILGDRQRLADHAGVLHRLRPDVVLDMILSSERQARALLDVFAGKAGRVVALSSMDVYRAQAVMMGADPGPLEPVPLREDSALRTRAPYGPEHLQMMRNIFTWVDEEYDKVPAERVILSHPALPGTVLRLPMVYGPGDPLHRFYAVVKRMDDGRRLIPIEETQAQWRGCRGYLENVTAAVSLAVTSEKAKGRVYNVAEPNNFTELEWTRKICDVAGWSGEVRAVERERCPAHLIAPGNYRQHWAADTSRIRGELGYREPVAIEEAIRRTLAWERGNHPAEWPFAKFDYDAEDGIQPEGV